MRRRIEDHDIGEVAGDKAAALTQSQIGGRQRGQSVDRLASGKAFSSRTYFPSSRAKFP